MGEAPTTLIVGCGYLGRRVGASLAARGGRVVGTVRSAARAREVTAHAIEPILADVLDPATLAGLPRADRLVYCVGHDRAAGIPMRSVYVDGLRNVLDHLEAQGWPGRFAYVSSTGVYGQDDGGWVDETSPTEPGHESGRVVLEAETLLRRRAEAGGLSAIVLRLSGLYGPGRVVRRASLERGEPIVGDPDKFLNWIHVDDAAEAVVSALDRGGQGGLYLASDDRPVTRREYYGRLAEALGASPPEFVSPEPGSDEARRDRANRRISNRRLRAELGVSLRYPDIASGLPAALASG